MKWIREQWPIVAIITFCFAYAGVMIWTVERRLSDEELWHPTVTAEDVNHQARICQESGGVPIIERRTFPRKRRFRLSSCDGPPFDVPANSTPPE